MDRTPPAPVSTANHRVADPDGLSTHDSEVVDSLIRLMTGNGVRVGAIQTTADPLHQLREEHGAPSATLRGFEFPVFTWLQEQAPTHTLHFVVIDQGERRFCFRVRRRRQSGPL